jgi:hypothetical protein
MKVSTKTKRILSHLKVIKFNLKISSQQLSPLEPTAQKSLQRPTL